MKESMGVPENRDETSLRGLLNKRLTEIKDEIAPDYKIPGALWDQMIQALEKGSPASKGAFTVEDLVIFNEETKSRLGNFLADVTAGIVPGSKNKMFDANGAYISQGSKDELQKKAEEERTV